MREIKFRGWSKGVKRMTYFNEPTVTCATTGDGEKWGMFLRSDDGVYLTGYQAVMQFTGLHDKNGKEIYEGDVLINPLGERAKIWFECAAGCFVMTSSLGRGYCLLPPSKDAEVIGNVYENPELIND